MSERTLGKKRNPICDLETLSGNLDEHDPIYDSESEHESCYFAKFGSNEFDRPVPVGKKLTLMEFIDKIKLIMEDLFASGDIGEAINAIRTLDCPRHLDYFTALSIRLALDRTESEQQKTAELLTVMYDSKVLLLQHVERGFEKLIQSIDDLRLDVPFAADRLMSFLMCAEDDKLTRQNFLRQLPESFLEALMPTISDNVAIVRQLEELREYKAACADFESDFFNSGDAGEVRKFLEERERPYFKHEFVKHLIKTSFDRTDWEREMVSKCLSDTFGTGATQFSREDIQLAFFRLLGSLEDLVLDCPDAPVLLAKYFARAIVDEIWAPINMRHCRRLRIGGIIGRRTLLKVMGWFKEKHGHMLSQQFLKIWTGTDPSREEALNFKREIRTTIFEYFDRILNLKETQQALNQMDLSPDQATEVVRKLMTFAMERTDKDCDAALKLLAYLLETKELDRENIHSGFDQTYKNLPDITIDIPSAGKRLAYFQAQAKRLELLALDYEDPTLFYSDF